MSPNGENESRFNAVRKLPDPAICRARHAAWPGMFFCLVHQPDGCKQVKYFNDVAYCTHPSRKAIIARTKGGEV